MASPPKAPYHVSALAGQSAIPTVRLADGTPALSRHDLDGYALPIARTFATLHQAALKADALRTDGIRADAIDINGIYYVRIA